MDIPKKNNSVKIKLNGKEPSFIPEKTIEEEPASAIEENQDAQFEWILPDTEQMANNERKSSLEIKKGGKSIKMRRKGSWTFPPAVLAITLAVLFGTSLGFLALKTITAKDHVTNGSIEGDKPAIDAAASPAGASEENIQPLSVFLVQGGVFSSKEAAEAIAADMDARQLPAEVFKLGENYHLFIGTAESLDASKHFTGYFKELQLDAYWKEVSFKAEMSVSLNKDEGQMLRLLTDLYESLTVHTSTAIMQNKSQTSGNETKNIEKLKTFDTIKNENLLQMKGNIELAASSEPLKAQGELLAFLKNYQQLVAESKE